LDEENVVIIRNSLSTTRALFEFSPMVSMDSQEMSLYQGTVDGDKIYFRARTQNACGVFSEWTDAQVYLYQEIGAKFIRHESINIQDVGRLFRCVAAGPPNLTLKVKPYTINYPFNLEWDGPRGDKRGLNYEVF